MDPRRQRLLTMLVTGLVILLGLITWLEPTESGGKNASQWTPAFPDLSPSGVDQLTLSGSGRSLRIERGEAGWLVVPPGDPTIGGKQMDPSRRLIADTRRVEQLLEALTALSLGPVLEVSDLGPHGLVQPRRVITLDGGGQTLAQVQVGRDAPVGTGTYVQIDGELRLTRYPLGTPIDGDLDFYRTREIIRFARSAVTGVQITGQTPAVALERDDHGWWLSGPTRERASASGVHALLDAMLDLRMVAYGAAAGRPEEQRSLRLTTPTGTQTLHVWRQGGGWWSDSPLHRGPVEITDGLARVLLASPDEWRSPMAMPARLESVTRIDLRLDGQEATATRAAGQWEASWAMAVLGGLRAVQVDRAAPVPSPGTVSGSLTLTEAQGRTEILTFHQTVPGGRVGVDGAGGSPFLVPADLLLLLETATAG